MDVAKAKNLVYLMNRRDELMDLMDIFQHYNNQIQASVVHYRMGKTVTSIRLDLPEEIQDQIRKEVFDELLQIEEDIKNNF